MNTAGDRSELKWCDRRELLVSTLSAGILVTGLSQPAGAIGKGSSDLVLVVGATSTTGQDACKDLIAMGYKVRGFTRRAEDVQKAVIGTEFEQVEWVNGNLKEFSDLAPAMKGVKKVLFTPLLATRAGSDPTYFKETVSEDIELTRLVYSEGKHEFSYSIPHMPWRSLYVHLALYLYLPTIDLVRTLWQISMPVLKVKSRDILDLACSCRRAYPIGQKGRRRQIRPCVVCERRNEDFSSGTCAG